MNGTEELNERLSALEDGVARIADHIAANRERTSLTDRLAFNVAEAARLTGLAPNTLRAAIASGRLRTTRLGRRILVSRSALDAFLSADEHESFDGSSG